MPNPTLIRRLLSACEDQDAHLNVHHATIRAQMREIDRGNKTVEDVVAELEFTPANLNQFTTLKDRLDRGILTEIEYADVCQLGQERDRTARGTERRYMSVAEVRIRLLGE